MLKRMSFRVGDGPSCSTTDDEVRAPIAPITARLLDPHHDMDWDSVMHAPRTHSAFDGLRDFSVEAGLYFHKKKFLIPFIKQIFV